MRDLKSARGQGSNERWLHLRLRLVGLSLFVLLAVVFARAFGLQVLERDKLKGLAEDQYVREIDIPARRGEIYDRNGVPLAQSVDVDSIWVDPSLVPDVKDASRKLARALGLDSKELGGRLARARRFAWVKRQARSDEVAQVKALGIAGIGFTKEPRRYYPQRELLAHVIGVVGMDGRGLEGLELAFNDELSGQSAQMLSLRDARGRKLLTHPGAAEGGRDGARVLLTLDRHVQYLAEKALGRAVTKAKATSGMVVVLEPSTGELLALANHPPFNPNLATKPSSDVLRNRAALDLFEPGSTMKAFVVAAALEERTTAPERIYHCEMGAWDIGRHTIHDTHPYAWLTPGRVLQVSSNICTAKIAQELGRDRMSRYYARFGFGEKSGLGLPGEGKGMVPFPKAEISLATQSFGQGMSTTAVQLAAAYGALANGGRRMRPYLVSRVVDPDGVVLLENRPTSLGQVVSPKTAKQVVSMLESVVEKEGTAPAAKLADYTVAGKTGTAQKPDPVAGGYSDKRLASFIGIAPSKAPRAVILVVIDEPTTDVYGGLVAAPAFKEIAEGLLPYLGVPPAKPAPLATPKGAEPVAKRTEAPEAAPSPSVTERVAKGAVVVPNLVGRPSRDAVAQLLAVALEPQLVGSGIVVSQSPLAGVSVERGATVRLTMGFGTAVAQSRQR